MSLKCHCLSISEPRLCKYFHFLFELPNTNYSFSPMTKKSATTTTTKTRLLIHFIHKRNKSQTIAHSYCSCSFWAAVWSTDPLELFSTSLLPRRLILAFDFQNERERNVQTFRALLPVELSYCENRPRETHLPVMYKFRIDTYIL